MKESDRKPNKVWVDKGSEFYNNSFKKWLKDIEMYSIHNEGKSAVAEKCIRTLKTKIYKYITLVSKNVYIEKLDDIADKYNNKYHRTIKMKPVDVKDITYIDFEKKLMSKILSLKLVIMSKFVNTKIFLLTDIHQIGLKKFLLLLKLKMQFHGHMLLMILMVKKLLEYFMKNNCKGLIKTNLRLKR